jgi:hypothetical protein
VNLHNLPIEPSRFLHTSLLQYSQKLARANEDHQQKGRFEMSKKIKIVAGVSIAVVLLAALLVGTVLAQGPPPVLRTPFGRWSGFGWGGGMMGHLGYGVGPRTGVTGTVPYGYGLGGCHMHGGWGSLGTGTPVSMEQAIEASERYLAAYGNPDLALTEVMEFSNHFYAEVKERSTGIYAFELFINRYTGAVYPEMGPNMMWNTKYGHMGGWWWGTPTAEMPVTAAQARQYAQQFLDTYLPGTTVAGEVDAFYGYYTIHVLRDGEVIGMLSVNGYTGQVWYHTWHGDLIDLRELEASGE